jgi:hypothetical protein
MLAGLSRWVDLQDSPWLWAKPETAAVSDAAATRIINAFARRIPEPPAPI